MKARFIISMFFFILMNVLFISCEKDEKTNSLPVIQSITVTPNTINTNGIVTITVVAADADKDVLNYTYQVTGGSITGTGPNVTWTAPSTDGAHSVTVTVSDGKGGVATQSATLTVLKPITQVTGTASFVAGVSGDLSNAKVSLYTSLENFELNQPVVFAAVNGTGGNVTFTISNILPGNYYLSVWKDVNNTQQLDDGDYIGIYGVINLGAYNFTELQVKEGQTFSCEVDMIILDQNNNPIITAFDINPTKACINQQVQVSVTAFDEDEDPLTFSYEVSGGTIIGEGNKVIWEVPNFPGNYTIKVTVSDGKNGEAVKEKILEVIVPSSKITGTAQFADGISGNLANANANLYLTKDDWTYYKPFKQVKVSGYGEKVTFVLKDLCPGIYYSDVWKDNDGNGVWSVGDFIGIYGKLSDGKNGLAQIKVEPGQNITINIDVYDVK